MPVVDQIRSRVLHRLLNFCHEKELIGPYRIKETSVEFISKSEPKSLTTTEALSYLINLTEEAGLGDQFHNSISKNR